MSFAMLDGEDGYDVYCGDDGEWGRVVVDHSESDQVHFSVNLEALKFGSVMNFPMG